MSDLIKIAVDAMGGDNSPQKVIDGIVHNHNSNKENFFQIFGDKQKIHNYLGNKINKDYFEIIHTEEIVKSTDSPLEAAKRGKNTSMWLSIESVKQKKADIVISAGNTGALLVIAKLNLKMIKNIDKPALSALWPNKVGMSVVLRCSWSLQLWYFLYQPTSSDINQRDDNFITFECSPSQTSF